MYTSFGIIKEKSFETSHFETCDLDSKKDINSFSNRLMRFLKDLDQDVNITIKPKPKNRKSAHISVSIARPIESMVAKSK